MIPPTDSNFGQYLRDAEQKGTGTARLYPQLVAALRRGELPDDLTGLERLQSAWLAHRRFVAHVGAPEAALPWPPVAAWLEDRSRRYRDRRTTLRPDETCHVVAVRRHQTGLAAWCIACGEPRVEVADEAFHEEVARGAAHVVVDGHDRSGGGAYWCEELDVVPGKAKVLWLEPPEFRAWPEVVRARGPEGARARAEAERVARKIESAQDVRDCAEADRPVLCVASCSCGYLATASWADPGDQCPVCGFAGPD